MSIKLQLRRGLETDLPTLAVGEPGFCTDTYNFFIGSAAGNQGIAPVASPIFTGIVTIGKDAEDVSALSYTLKSADSTGAGHDGSKLVLQGGLGGAGGSYGTVEIINSRLNLVDGSAAMPAISFTSETSLGMFRPSAGAMGFGVSGSERVRFTAITSGGRVEVLDAGALGGLALCETMGTPDVKLVRDAANTLAIRNSTAQQILRVYNTSDASGALTNYERLTITGVLGASLNITAETAGGGADNLDIILTPSGTGLVRIGARLRVTNCPNYANNAAALAGGLVSGDFYTVTGTNPLQVAKVI